MGLKYQVTTEPHLDGVIVQKLTIDDDLVPDHLTPLQKMTQWIIDTRDHQVREALITLGWTPPGKELMKEFSDLYDLRKHYDLSDISP